ncbi:hypothetical protein AAG906_016177 [Vitis piasezkii]
MELELKVELRICGYRWSIDLMIPSRSGHLYDSKVLIIHLDFRLPPQNHVLACFMVFKSWLSLELHSWRRVGGRLIRADSHQGSDSLVEMSDELASTLASIQEFMAGVSRCLDQIESSHQDHHPVGISIDETVPHAS